MPPRNTGPVPRLYVAGRRRSCLADLSPRLGWLEWDRWLFSFGGLPKGRGGSRRLGVSGALPDPAGRSSPSGLCLPLWLLVLALRHREFRVVAALHVRPVVPSAAPAIAPLGFNQAASVATSGVTVCLVLVLVLLRLAALWGSGRPCEGSNRSTQGPRTSLWPPPVRTPTTSASSSQRLACRADYGD